MKKQKNGLSPDTVSSDKFHVGIELELRAPCESNSGGHDDDACRDSHELYLSEHSDRSILRDFIGVTSGEADAIAPYFNRESWQEDHMGRWSCDGDCNFEIEDDGNGVRYSLELELKRLTGNTSFKVVEDGSIRCGDGKTDAEVCWNYYASKETLKDNQKILAFLEDEGCDFDTSCGLHINLNNYLSVPRLNDGLHVQVPTNRLSFLFNLVAPSRASSSYCSGDAISGNRKYSMIYHQGDRLEFRFFSPTLCAEKLNNYVATAHFIYRRLAGQNVKLPGRLRAYLREKMIVTNGLSESLADDTLARMEVIPSMSALIIEQSETDQSEEREAS